MKRDMAVMGLSMLSPDKKAQAQLDRYGQTDR